MNGARQGRNQSSNRYVNTEAQRGAAATKLGFISRKDAKARREDELSFRTKREILVSSEGRNNSQIPRIRPG